LLFKSTGNQIVLAISQLFYPNLREQHSYCYQHFKMPSFFTTVLITIAMLLMSAARVESTQKTLPSSSCQLQLQLDQHPADTAWEIRGPFPAVDLVASRDYDYYQTPDALAQESVELVDGGTYHLILTDYANDGIVGGHFLLTRQETNTVATQQVLTNTVATQQVLVQGDGRFGAGKVYTFEVPKRTSSSSSLLWSLGRTLSLLTITSLNMRMNQSNKSTLCRSCPI
jgi:hypothetical protein